MNPTEGSFFKILKVLNQFGFLSEMLMTPSYLQLIVLIDETFPVQIYYTNNVFTSWIF